MSTIDVLRRPAYHGDQVMSEDKAIIEAMNRGAASVQDWYEPELKRLRVLNAELLAALELYYADGHCPTCCGLEEHWGLCEGEQCVQAKARAAIAKTREAA